jgi:hypothetical protein
MSFPIGSKLFSPQNPAYLPAFTLWLTANNAWKVVPADGIYAPPGDVLTFFPGPNNPYLPGEPGPANTPNITAANFMLGPLPATGSLVGMPLRILWDPQGYAIGDGKKSGTVYAPPGASGLTYPYSTFASITVPAGELLLLADFGAKIPCTQAFICPVSYAKRMNWQIQSLGG